MKSSDTFKKDIGDNYGISFRLPKIIGDQMYALTEKSGKTGAAFIAYAVRRYIAEVSEQPFEDNDPFEIDRLSWKLLNNQKNNDYL